jgi:hypothetical protein
MTTASATQDLVGVYNRYLVQLLVTLKERDPAAKRALARNYRAIDTASDEYVRFGAANLPHARFADLGRDQMLGDADVLDAPLLPDVPLRALLTRQPQLPAEAPLAHRLRSLLYLLSVLASAHAPGPAGEGGAALVRQVLQTVAALQRASADGAGDAATLIEAVLDDDIRPVLVRLHEEMAEANAASAAAASAAGGNDASDASGASGASDMPDMPDINPLKGFENSKIADLAKEISEEINLDDLNVPDMFDFSKLGDSNSALGSIVSKVGSKIQKKLQSGEVSQQDLMTEAMSMLAAFNGGGAGAGGSGGAGAAGNVMLQQAMAAMRSGRMPAGAAAAAAAMFAGTPAGPTGDSSGVRARLRHKLDARKS